MKKTKVVVLSIMLSLMLVGFKPGPSAGLPRFVYKGAEIEFLSLTGRVAIDSTKAHIVFSALVEVPDSVEFAISIKADSAIIWVNGYGFMFNKGKHEVPSLPKGINFIEANYIVSTDYVFSKEKNESKEGYQFELLSPFIKDSESFIPVLPKQMAFSVIVPDNFKFDIDKNSWTITDDKDSNSKIFLTTTPEILKSNNRWYHINK